MLENEIKTLKAEVETRNESNSDLRFQYDQLRISYQNKLA